MVRAVGVTQFGGPEVLTVLEVPERHAGPGEVRVRVRAAGVNPTDTLQRTGLAARWSKVANPFPTVPGMDVAGTVDEVGPDVRTGLRVGDDVMAVVMPKGPHGGYSESLVLPAESVVAMPTGATFVEAATLPMNGLTARLALDLLALSPGATLAVTGAAGAVGGYTIGLGKADGLRVLADASEADEVLVRSFGADLVVRRGGDVASRFLEAAPGGVDGLVDGAVLGDAVYSAIRDGGTYASVRFDHPRDAAPRGILSHQVLVSAYGRNHAALEALRHQAEEGRLPLRVARTFRPEDAGEAHWLLEAGGVRGRFVIEF